MGGGESNMRDIDYTSIYLSVFAVGVQIGLGRFGVDDLEVSPKKDSVTSFKMTQTDLNLHIYK